MPTQFGAFKQNSNRQNIAAGEYGLCIRPLLHDFLKTDGASTELEVGAFHAFAVNFDACFFERCDKSSLALSGTVIIHDDTAYIADALIATLDDVLCHGPRGFVV